MSTIKNLWTKFRNEKYRKGFVAAEVKRMIPFQVGALRKVRGFSQEELAKRSGLTQGVISRAEDPDYGNLTLNTVVKIANGFDVAFVGMFVPYSKLADWYVNLSQDNMRMPSFEEEEKSAMIDTEHQEDERALEPVSNALSQVEKRFRNVVDFLEERAEMEGGRQPSFQDVQGGLLIQAKRGGLQRAAIGGASG